MNFIELSVIRDYSTFKRLVNINQIACIAPTANKDVVHVEVLDYPEKTWHFQGTLGMSTKTLRCKGNYDDLACRLAMR